MNTTDRVIAFSLFGGDPKYRLGVLQNVHALDRVYPGWGILVYCDRTNQESLMRESLGPNVQVILQQERSEGMEGMSWRLLASLRDEMRAVLFRDADSLFSTREADVVNEWLQSTYDTHIIRDHPYHQSPIMGGTLGVKGEALRLLAALVRERLRSHRRTEYGDDQIFLNHYFYPKIRANALIHTNCVRYFPERTQPLPSDRYSELFIGAYAFLSPEEQLKYAAIRATEPPRTLLPPHWQRNRLLKKVLKLYRPVHRIRHGCRWRL